MTVPVQGSGERHRAMTSERLQQIRDAAGYEFNPGTISVAAAWELIAEVDRLSALLVRYDQQGEVLTWISDPSYVGNHSDAEIIEIHRKWAKRALSSPAGEDEETR